MSFHVKSLAEKMSRNTQSNFLTAKYFQPIITRGIKMDLKDIYEKLKELWAATQRQGRIMIGIIADENANPIIDGIFIESDHLFNDETLVIKKTYSRAEVLSIRFPDIFAADYIAHVERTLEEYNR